MAPSIASSVDERHARSLAGLRVRFANGLRRKQVMRARAPLRFHTWQGLWVQDAHSGCDNRPEPWPNVD